MTCLWLLATLGGVEIALSAEHITSIAQIGKIMPVPLSPPAIAGLATLRSRIVVVVDGAALLGEAQADNHATPLMALAEVDGFTYGLLLDAVDDVQLLAAPEPCPMRLSPQWVALDPMMVQHDGRVRIAFHPARLVAMAQSLARDHAQQFQAA